jgi:cell shape-determining protein MreC
MLLYSLDVRHGNYAVWLRQAVFWIEEPVLRVAEGVNWIERLVFLAQEGDDLLRAQETELFEHRLMTRRDHPQYKPAQAILPIQRVLPAARIHVAEIVAHRVNPLHHYIWVGVNDMVGKKMRAVFSATGLLGHVSRYAHGRSRVTVLDDIDSKIPVYTKLNQTRGVLSGQGSGHDLSLAFVPLHARVKVGDSLMTSGLGGVYPMGYPVAQIVSIVRDAHEPFLRIKARPYADSYRYFYVFFLDATQALVRSSSLAC